MAQVATNKIRRVLGTLKECSEAEERLETLGSEVRTDRTAPGATGGRRGGGGGGGAWSCGVYFPSRCVPSRHETLPVRDCCHAFASTGVSATPMLLLKFARCSFYCKVPECTKMLLDHARQISEASGALQNILAVVSELEEQLAAKEACSRGMGLTARASPASSLPLEPLPTSGRASTGSRDAERGRVVASRSLSSPLQEP